ncbi:MAG: hypothetical protein ACXIVO_01335 [Glycocaulis sp.]
MTTTWTAVFEADAYPTEWPKREDALTPPDGQRMLNALAEALRTEGWGFGHPFEEDHGWHTEALASGGKKATGVSLVIAPSEGDASSKEYGWRVVIGINMGLFAGTKGRRHSTLLTLGEHVSDAIRLIGGRDVNWQNGPLENPAAQ